VSRGVRLGLGFWGLGLFCIKSLGEKTEGGEERAEDGFGAGGDSRGIGICDFALRRVWGWQFGEFGRFMVMMILGS